MKKCQNLLSWNTYAKEKILFPQKTNASSPMMFSGEEEYSDAVMGMVQVKVKEWSLPFTTSIYLIWSGGIGVTSMSKDFWQQRRSVYGVAIEE